MHIKILPTACMAVRAFSSPQHISFRKLEVNTTGTLLNTTLSNTTTNTNLTLTSQSTTMTQSPCPTLSPLKSHIAQVNASLWSVTQMNRSSLSASTACSAQQFTVPCTILFDPVHAHFLVCAAARGTGLFQIASAWSSWYLSQAILDLRGVYEDLQTFDRNGTKPSDERCNNLPWDTMIRARVDTMGISRLLCGWVAEPLPGYRSGNRTAGMGGCEGAWGMGYNESRQYETPTSVVNMTTTEEDDEGDGSQ